MTKVANIPSGTILRPVREEDIPLITTWLYTEEISRWFGDPEGWLEEIRGRHSSHSWVKHVIAEKKGNAFGFAQYYEAARSGPGYPWDDQPEGSYGIDYLIGDPKSWGRGLGTELVALIDDLVMREPGLRRLFADPAPAHAASIKVLVRNGYSLEKVSGLYVKDVRRHSETA